MPLVSVCVCTYRRAHVAETIKSLLAQRLSADETFEIVVIDDDRDRSAESIVARFQDAPILVRYA
ncbi:MAG TPA: glycosyltransferase, partial [Verrucomicrobiae bacterium]|nr:glycosyltransferase [Verrucomicrobiae bacterium]